MFPFVMTEDTDCSADTEGVLVVSQLDQCQYCQETDAGDGSQEYLVRREFILSTHVSLQ